MEWTTKIENGERFCEIFRRVAGEDLGSCICPQKGYYLFEKDPALRALVSYNRGDGRDVSNEFISCLSDTLVIFNKGSEDLVKSTSALWSKYYQGVSTNVSSGADCEAIINKYLGGASDEKERLMEQLINYELSAGEDYKIYHVLSQIAGQYGGEFGAFVKENLFDSATRNAVVILNPKSKSLQESVGEEKYNSILQEVNQLSTYALAISRKPDEEKDCSKFTAEDLRFRVERRSGLWDCGPSYASRVHGLMSLSRRSKSNLITFNTALKSIEMEYIDGADLLESSEEIYDFRGAHEVLKKICELDNAFTVMNTLVCKLIGFSNIEELKKFAVAVGKWY